MNFLNRCAFTAVSAGTGDFVVSAAANNGYVPADCLDPIVVDGATYNYFAIDGTDHEEGTGIWTTSTSTLTRATVRNSSNSAAAVNFSSAPTVFMGGPIATDMRIKLTADTTYHVATTGSDTTGNGTAGNPWATLAFAHNWVADSIDFDGYNIALQLADGSYAGCVVPTFYSSLGARSSNTPGSFTSPSFQILGNAADHTLVVIDQDIPNFYYGNPNGVGFFLLTNTTVAWGIRDVTFDWTAVGGDWAPITTGYQCYIFINDQDADGNQVGTIEFKGNTSGGSAGDGIAPESAGTQCFVFGNVIYNGGTFDYFMAAFGGAYLNNYNATITYSNNPTVGGAGYFCGQLEFNQVSAAPTVVTFTTVTFSGSFTGLKFEVGGSNSFLDTSQLSGGLEALPGTGWNIWDNGAYVYKDSNGNRRLLVGGDQSSSGTPITGSKVDTFAAVIAGLPSTSLLTQNTWNVFKDSSGGGVYLTYNDAGTIKHPFAVTGWSPTSANDLVPDADNSSDIGDGSHRVKNIYATQYRVIAFVDYRPIGKCFESVTALTLSNGLNSDVSLNNQGLTAHATGPTGGFSIGGFVPDQSTGQIFKIYNATSQQMTIVNEDASSTAVNRIKTLTGADVVLRAGTSFASFYWDGTDQRWILMSTN